MAKNPYAMDDDEPIDQDARDELPEQQSETPNDDAPRMRNNQDPIENSNAKGRGKGGKCGCGCVAAIIILLAVIVGIIVMGVHYLKTSIPFTYPAKLAEQHPIIASALGTPIEIGMMREGNIEFENDDGKADFRFPITGPNGAAELTVQAVKTDGVWVFSRITCTLTGTNQIIDLASEPVRVEASDDL